MRTKRYFVLMQTKILGFVKHTNSLRVAMWLANLKFWTYAKIHDTNAEDVKYPQSKCIYINDRRS
jgi:hypothetical protein